MSEVSATSANVFEDSLEVARVKLLLKGLISFMLLGSGYKVISFIYTIMLSQARTVRYRTRFRSINPILTYSVNDARQSAFLISRHRAIGTEIQTFNSLQILSFRPIHCEPYIELKPVGNL